MPPSLLSQEALIQTCLNTWNESAWDEFIRRFQPVIAGTVVKTLRLAGGDAAQYADDVIQEVFVKLCDKDCQTLRNFQPDHDNAFFGFLKRIAYNETLNFLRRRRTGTRDDGEIPDIPVQPGQDALLLEREIGELLDEATSSEKDKAVFWLYYRQGYTARAISEIGAIGLKEKGVESKIFALTKRIRDLLEKK